MALFKLVVEAYIPSRELDQATLSRLCFGLTSLAKRKSPRSPRTTSTPRSYHSLSAGV